MARDIVVGLRIDADGTAAVTQLRGLEGALDRVGNEGQQAGAKAALV
ncbi:hypothetical protein HC761_00055 [bacterium]|nr:hypothetical protein [bacterium]